MINKTLMPAWLLVALLAFLGGCEGSRLGNPSTNVLKQVDPARDAVEGRWDFDRNHLQSEATPNARIALPSVPHGDYELRLTFARVVGQGAVSVMLPVGDAQVMVVLAGDTDGPSGLDYVDGRRNEVSTDTQLELTNHRVYRMKATVRTRGADARIDVDIDDRPFVRWRGVQSALALPPQWQLKGGATLGIGSANSVVQVHTVRVRTVPGEIDWVN